MHSCDDTIHGPRRGLVPEDLLRYAWLDSIALDPTGKQLAYVVRRIDAAHDAEVGCLWLHDRATGRTTPIESRRGRVGSLAWSREGDRLAYVLTGPHLGSAGWVLVVTSPGEAHSTVECADDGGVPSALDWSPDGRTLACVRWTADSTNASEEGQGSQRGTYRRVRRLRYKQDGVGWVGDRFRQIWTVDPFAGTWTQRSSTDLDHGEPCWSWDGTRIAFTVTAREQDMPLGYGQIRILDVRSGVTIVPLPAWKGMASGPKWRADDAVIAFTGHDHPPPVHRRRFAHVWTVDLASGEPTDLTERLDAQVGNYAVSDLRPGLTTVTVAWPGGTGDLWFLSTDRGRVHLCRVDPDDGRPRVEVGGNGVVFAFSVANDGSVAYGRTDPRTVGDLYLLGETAPRRIAALNAWVEDHALSEPIEMNVVTDAGDSVHAWEMKPIERQQGVPYPAIVQVHCSMFSWGFSHENQCLVTAGFVVHYANQVGTTAGYGQAHALGNYVGHQHLEAAEILFAVDELARRPYVDASRIGVTGGSCGGYMTNWLVTRTDRFRAAVTQRSIANLVSKFGTGDNGPEQATAEGARPPWSNVDTLWRNSPLAHVHRVTTPMLILHASDDHRCPLSQAEEWFSALRWQGVPTQLVVFEGESHGLTRSGRPSNRLDHLCRLRDWFTTHLAKRNGVLS